MMNRYSLAGQDVQLNSLLPSRHLPQEMWHSSQVLVSTLAKVLIEQFSAETHVPVVSLEEDKFKKRFPEHREQL